MSKKTEGKRKLITEKKINSPISEQFKLVRTGIEFAGVDSVFKTILVTSPEATTGKSTVASNLAVVYAQKGKKTLLIDADMRKPTIHKIFSKSLSIGLSNCLTETVLLSEICQKTEIKGLFVLTSGELPPNPNELLGSKRMALLMNEIKKGFDIVIIDTPPVTVVSDALVLATQSDGIILVVRSRITTKNRAKKAIEQIKMTRVPIIGVVLNGDSEKESDTYYYGYN